MKTESVKDISWVMQIGADLGLNSFQLNGLVILTAVVGAALFASYAQRWI